MVFRFYCDISGELCCVTKPIQADTEEAALEIAWDKEGKWEFNLCPKCGKYVSSAMFNVNASRCLDCAPWESEYPSFCHHCGVRLRESDACFCPVCGARLQVGGTDGKEECLWPNHRKQQRTRSLRTPEAGGCFASTATSPASCAA